MPGTVPGIDEDALAQRIWRVPGVEAARVCVETDRTVRCDVQLTRPSQPTARLLASLAGPDPLWILPNGAPVHAVNGHELAYMVWEQATRDTYRLADLPADAVVVDVGANVGLFSLLAAARSPGARVIAIEPMPALADTIRASVELHGLEQRVEVRAHALGARAEDATFVMAPLFAALSSRHLAERHDITRRFGLAVRMLVPGLGRRHGLDLERAKAWLASQLVEEEATVRVETLSTVLEGSGLRGVDLLKVDVEGSELEVLRGIDDAHWEGIERVAAEVNDVDGRIDAVGDLLRAHGYAVVIEEDDSASRAVPQRIGVVHASRRPLGPRREPPAVGLAGEEALGAEAVAVGREVARAVLAEGAPGARVRVVGSDARPRRDLRETDLAEQVCAVLAEVLGVPALAMSSWWRAGGVVVEAGAAQ